MKTKITQLSMLLIALFFMNNVNAQSGDYEYLFNTDGDAEGFEVRSGGTITVSGGILTYEHGGTGVNLPVGNLIDRTNFPYLAIQVDQLDGRLELFLRTGDGPGGWYNETDVPNGDAIVNYWDIDPTLNGQGVYYWDLNYLYWDNPAEELTNGGTIDLAIFRLSDGVETNINWVKTFASVQDITDYAAANPFPSLSTDDFAKSQTKVISRENSIDIVKAEVNAKIEVFDLLGKQLHSSVAKSSDVSIPLFSKGLHIIKISGEQSVITKKVILQ